MSRNPNSLKRDLAEFPAIQSAQKERLKSVVQQAMKKKQDLKPIQGTAKEDAATINAVDQVCLDALEALR